MKFLALRKTTREYRRKRKAEKRGNIYILSINHRDGTAIVREEYGAKKRIAISALPSL